MSFEHLRRDELRKRFVGMKSFSIQKALRREKFTLEASRLISAEILIKSTLIVALISSSPTFRFPLTTRIDQEITYQSSNRKKFNRV
jgi:hypothetical protein